MSCTSEEIAEKRRIALERLKSKRQIPCTSSSSSASSSSLTEKSTNFYGSTANNNNNNITSPKNVSNDNKIGQQNPYKNARILSQPYNTKTTAAATTIAPIFTKQISCVCSMITSERFNVVPSGFHAKLIDVFKTIPSRAYSRFLTQFLVVFHTTY